MENKIDKEQIFSLLKLITLIWVGIIIIIIFYNIIPTSEKYIDLKSFWLNLNFVSFNNWGDFFAGFFAPLAFAWLGYGILIQREEFATLSSSIDLQKGEMEVQSGHMAKQVNMMVSQDLANSYTRYSKNLNNLYNVNNVLLPSLNKDFTEPSGLSNIICYVENIEDILLRNNQIEKYFFSRLDSELGEVIEMLQTDYNVLQKKHIENIKELYIKIAIMKYSQKHYPEIDLKPNVPFSNYVKSALEQKVSYAITHSKLEDEYAITNEVFNKILLLDDVLEYIEIGGSNDG